MVATGNSLIFDYTVFLGTVKDRSAKTVDGYASDLSVFFRYIMIYFDKDLSLDEFGAVNTDTVGIEMIKQVDGETLSAFVGFLKEHRHNNDNTCRRKLSTLSDFFSYLMDTCYLLDSNPVVSFKPPKAIPSETSYLSLSDAKRLLSSVDGMHKTRDYAILMLFLTCGLKLSEVCELKRSDYQDDSLRIVGNHGHSRFVHVNETCKNALLDYMAIRETIKSMDGAYFFLSSRNKGLKRRSVHQLVQKHIVSAGLDPSLYSAHSLRHTCAMLLYNEDADIATVQSILGHSSSSITAMMYTHATPQKNAEAIDNNPLNMP